MNILYVEDSDLEADLTQRELARLAPSLMLDRATGLGEALDRLKNPTSKPYDLVLSDLRFPDGSGLDLLAYVRENYLPVAVVIITGQGDEESALTALKTGATDYIVKHANYLKQLPATLQDAHERFRSEVARQARKIRVLYAEPNPVDIDLTRRHFTRHAAYIKMEFVHTKDELFKRLPQNPLLTDFDVLLLDYRLAGINALEVLKELQLLWNTLLPVVLVTGHGAEDIVSQAIKLGAYDYVVKDAGYLQRLTIVIENAFHRGELLREQDALRESEARFRRLAENAQDGIYRYRLLPQKGFEYISPAISTITGYAQQAFYEDPDLWLKLVQAKDHPKLMNILAGTPPPSGSYELRCTHKNDQMLWIDIRQTPVRDEMDRVTALEGLIRDISERKRSEAQIHRHLQRLTALHDIDQAINASLDLNLILSLLLEQILRQLGADAAAILLLNPHYQQLEYVVSKGFALTNTPNAHLRLGEDLAGRSALERTVVHTHLQQGELQDAKLANLFNEEGFVEYYGAPLIAKGQVKGVLEVFLRKQLEIDDEWLNFLETLAGQAAIAIDSSELFENLQRSNMELSMAYDSTLEGWVHALDLRDRESEGHTQRVAEMCLRLSSQMGIGDDQLTHIRRGALLHDIGKIGVPDHILHKEGPLDEAEWDYIRKHPGFAYELLAPISYLQKAMDIPYCHHEHFDGSGYPRGLKGEQIPLSARIFAVVDVWDALRSDRPFRPAWTFDQALDYIQKNAGAHFDPQVVAQFLNLVRSDGFTLDSPL
jgi:PAS domain S-box-containing protein